MKMSKMMQLMCNTEMWQNMIDKADEKGLDMNLIRDLCHSKKRERLLQRIFEGKHDILPPRIALIPKDDKGQFRTVYINTDLDRIILTLVNDCLSILFKDMVHPNCVSYQKGKGTQEIVQKASNAILKYRKGYKTDFSKYFDNVSIRRIDEILDKVEVKLYFEIGCEPVVEMLRRYFHCNLYFDQDGNLCEIYQGLKQGNATASWMANACLYELDEYMSNKYSVYYRYSDDIICIDRDVSHVVDDINRFSSKANVVLNPKKVKAIYGTEWFKFLGFNIKGSLITLSENRIKKFQKEIEKRSIKRFKKKGLKSAKMSKQLIYRYLYEGDNCWASSCLRIITSESDLKEMNNFIIDCIRAVETGKRRIGGLGCQLNGKDGVIQRGKGKHVKANRLKTENIENYLSVRCMADNMNISMNLFETIVMNCR